MFDASTMDGSQTIPAPTGGTQTGQPGNGYARITRLPYYVLVGGHPCVSVEIIDDNQISCIVRAHPAAVIDVTVYVGGTTSTRTNGFTYTDTIHLSGPTALYNHQSGTYTITLDYYYTGTITLDDGDVGGTFSTGPTISFDNETSHVFTYTPPYDFQGDLILTASSGVSYVVDDNITVSVTNRATSFDLACLSDGSTGSWTTNPFFDPGTPLSCRVTLNGIYDGVIDLGVLVAGDPATNGTFASADPRFSADHFTLTSADTQTPTDQTLYFTYTPPTWQWIIDNVYDGANGYWVFWPTLNATSTPALVPGQRSVSMGLLAQEYDIISINNPPLTAPGTAGCVGCVASFIIYTHNAPYFGSITIDSSTMESGSPTTGGQLFAGGAWDDSITINFNGSGASELFRYRPSIVGDIVSGDAGYHTLTGTSSSPAISDTDVSFYVINSNIYFYDCNPTYIARGQTATCTLYYNSEGADAGVELSVFDVFISSYAVESATNLGTFTDTSAQNGNPDNTWDGSAFSFCGGLGSTDCTGETWQRTFTFTIPENTPDDYIAFRIMANNNSITPVDTNWVTFDIIPDKLTILCTDEYPDCAISRVGQLQNYILRPNGVFIGEVTLTDDTGDGIFSDNGIATWNWNGDDFIFEYTPATSGIRTITATVTRSDNPESGLEVGDTFTFQVIVMGDEIYITGPDLVSRDDVPAFPRFAAILEGPFIGTITGRMVRFDSSTEIAFLNSNLTGFNMTDLGGGTFSCTITQEQFESGTLYPGGPPFYDPVTNTTTACIADSAGPAGFIDEYNWFEIHAAVQDAPAIPEAIHHVGLVADDFTVTHNSTDATAAPIIATIGVPVSFTLTPNALFAGTYAFASEADGYFSPSNINRIRSQWPATNVQTLQTSTFAYVPTTPGKHTITVSANRSVPDSEDLPAKTIEIIALANQLTLSGPSSIVRGQFYTYTVTLNGPWDGRIYFSDSLDDDLNDTIDPLFCDFTLSDYDAETGTTSCTFSLAIAPTDPYVNRLTILASDLASTVSDSLTVNVLASSFTLTPSTATTPVGQAVTLTLTPTNGLHSGSFSTATSSSGTFSPTSIAFDTSDWPVDDTPMTGKTFTYTPTTPGVHIITVTSSTLGTQTATITVPGNTINITGPTSIQKGTTSETFTLSINGPYAGTVDLQLYTPADPAHLPIPSDFTLSTDICTFTFSDFNTVTGTTSCTFTVSIPAAPSEHLNFIGISATAPGLTGDPIVAITAADFEVTTTENLSDIETGVPLTFTITPDALFSGAFTLSDNMGGIFSPLGVTFNSADWPETTNHTLPSGLTFTYTPRREGSATISICNAALGCKYIDLFDIHGPYIPLPDPDPEPETPLPPATGFLQALPGYAAPASLGLLALVSTALFIVRRRATKSN